jgi:hypothetical protein
MHHGCGELEDSGQPQLLLALADVTPVDVVVAVAAVDGIVTVVDEAVALTSLLRVLDEEEEEKLWVVGADDVETAEESEESAELEVSSADDPEHPESDNAQATAVRLLMPR